MESFIRRAALDDLDNGHPDAGAETEDSDRENEDYDDAVAQNLGQC